MKYIIMLLINIMIIAFFCYIVLKIFNKKSKKVYLKGIDLLITLAIVLSISYFTNTFMITGLKECIIKKFSNNNIQNIYCNSRSLDYDSWTAYPENGEEYEIYLLP